MNFQNVIDYEFIFNAIINIRHRVIIKMPGFCLHISLPTFKIALIPQMYPYAFTEAQIICVSSQKEFSKRQRNKK